MARGFVIFFKNHFKARGVSALLTMTLVGGLLFQIGCDRFLMSSDSQKSKDKQDVVEIKTSSLDCLSQLPHNLQLFVEDRASEDILNQTFACVDHAIDYFGRYTSGSQPDVYSDEELRYFFNRYLFSKNQISPDLMRELMRLKALFVGGSPRSATRLELGQTRGLLSLVAQQAQALRGQMRLILFQKDPTTVTSSELQTARKSTQEFVSKILQESKAVGSMYEFSDFMRFVKEFKAFAGGVSVLDPMMKWLPLVSSVKDLIFGEQSKLSSSGDWLWAADYSVRGYFVGLDYYYHLRDIRLREPESWPHLLGFIEDSFTLIEEAPALQKQGGFSTKLIDRALDEAVRSQVLETKIPLDILKQAYRMAILRLLDRNSSGQVLPSEVGSIEKKHIAVLRFEFNNWKLAAQSIVSIFSASPPQVGILPSEIREGLAKFPLAGAISQLHGGEFLRPQLVEAYGQFQGIFATEPVVQWTESEKLLLTSEPSKSKGSFVGLQWTAAMRSVLRLTLRGYGAGDPTNLWKQKISEKNLIALEHDFHEFAVALEFIDPRSPNPASRTFKEASFFTLHGDGDDGLDARELREELEFLVSSGFRLTNLSMKLAQQRGCETGEMDSFGYPLLEQKCFLATLKDQRASFFEGMPGLLQQANSMDQASWDSFMENWIQVSASDVRLRGVERSEIRTGLTVLQYVESLISVYDTDHNGKLSLAEVEKAAPRFRSFILSVSPAGNWAVDDIFLYLVFKGEKPGLSDLAAFKIRKAFGLPEVGRPELLKVLAVLKKDVANAPSSPTDQAK